MLWDPHVLARVRRLHLKARYLTSALMQGEHRSIRVGQAVEFAGYDQYQPGMDLRFLDWKVWGRSDQLVTRRFEAETELPTTVVLDLSGDLATGDPKDGDFPDLESSKAGYAITLAATLLYFFHLHGEPVGMEVLAGEGLSYRSMPARGGRNQLHQLFLGLASAKPGGQAQLEDALIRVGRRTRRRSLVMIISDGMEEPAQWLGALSAFAKRKSEVRFFHLWDQREWDLAFNKPALFYSPEGGETLAVDPAAARISFQRVAEEYVEEVRAGVTRWGGRYVPARSNESMETTIRNGLAVRYIEQARVRR